MKETLVNILEGLVEKVEILIVDGNSSDDTEVMVQEFSKRYSFIKYLKILEPLGFDAELSLGVHASLGKFSWIFSDDDLVLGKDVNFVTKFLDSNNDIELLLVNASIWNQDFKVKLQDQFVSKSSMNSNSVDILFEHFIDYLSFLGGCVIRKENWVNSDSSKYFGTLFVHVGIIFSHKSLNWFWLEDPIVSIRYGNASWTSKSQKIWLEMWPQLLDSFDTVSKSVKKRKVKISGITLLKKLIFFKAINLYNSEIKLSSNQLDNVFILKFVVFLANTSPKWVCYYFSLYYAYFTNKKTLIFDLKSL